MQQLHVATIALRALDLWGELLDGGLADHFEASKCPIAQQVADVGCDSEDAGGFVVGPGEQSVVPEAP